MTTPQNRAVVSPSLAGNCEQSPKAQTSDIVEFGHGDRSKVAVVKRRQDRAVLPLRTLPHGIRLIKEDDIEWGIDLALRRYPERFDLLAGENWMRNVVLRQPWMFFSIRTDNAFCITLLATIPWLPGDMEANVVAVCAEPGRGWEAAKLLRVSLEWAKRRKCTEWRFRVETEYDIGPLARRIGATELPPCYVVRF